MTTYEEKLYQAQAQLDGIEHDQAAAMARTIYAAKQIGYCHYYDTETRTDHLWNNNGESWSIPRGSHAKQAFCTEAIRAQLKHLLATA